MLTKTKKIALVATTAVVALVVSTSSAIAMTSTAGASQLPTSVKKNGYITVGVDATYRPNEFKNAKGNPIGWEVELVSAVAADLGIKVRYVVSTFDSILPAIKGGKYDAGISSFTDTKEREVQVDFANYFTAGTQWATQKGKTVDPMNACGLTVAAQTGATQVDDLKKKSADCVKAGKKAITLLSYDTQEAATAAVALGRAKAFAADSPVTADAVTQSKGKLALSGAIYGAAPYGMPTAKGSTLVKALSIAFNDLYKNGTYKSILKKWGVQAGAVSTFGVNGAIN